MTKICLYCKREKPINEFSQEHILPRGVGGNLIENPFAIHDVCARCNNLSGLFIDGPFIKSWFINNYRAEVAKKYCHITSETVLPLAYFGELTDFKTENKICDFWHGLTGDTIYHFHEPYPEELDTPPMVGLPPTAYRYEIDKGFVFLFVRSNNPVWLPAIIFSVIDNFKDTPIYLGNGNKPNISQFEEIPNNLKDLHENLWSIQSKEHSVRFSVGVNFSDRFLCKLALGFGSLHLNPSFKESTSADLLRQGMWTKNKQEWEKLPIRGTTVLGNKELLSDLDEIFKWKGGHTIALIKYGKAIALYTNFYEVNSSVIFITDNIEHWQDRIKDGLVYVIAPTLRKVVGPIVLSKYLSYKDNPTIEFEALKQLELEMDEYSNLPPFQI